MNFNKNNSFIMGMNYGFGAGYMKLIKSWFPVIKLIKLKYITIFHIQMNPRIDLENKLI